jgi:hypothetical protein
MFDATEQEGSDRVATIGESFFWRVSIGDAAGEIRILNRETTTVCFRKRANGERVRIDKDLVDLHQLSGFMNGLVVQPHELFSPKRDHGVCLALVVAELNFVHIRGPNLDDRANLTAD